MYACTFIERGSLSEPTDRFITVLPSEKAKSFGHIFSESVIYGLKKLESHGGCLWVLHKWKQRKMFCELQPVSVLMTSAKYWATFTESSRPWLAKSSTCLDKPYRGIRVASYSDDNFVTLLVLQVNVAMLLYRQQLLLSWPFCLSCLCYSPATVNIQLDTYMLENCSTVLGTYVHRCNVFPMLAYRWCGSWNPRMRRFCATFGTREPSSMNCWNESIECW
jgi:hypothetical protein